jgi:hypothetical protein
MHITLPPPLLMEAMGPGAFTAVKLVVAGQPVLGLVTVTEYVPAEEMPVLWPNDPLLHW